MIGSPPVDPGSWVDFVSGLSDTTEKNSVLSSKIDLCQIAGLSVLHHSPGSTASSMLWQIRLICTDKVDLNCRHLQLSAVIPRFTVQFGEREIQSISGKTVKCGTIIINLHIKLVFGGKKRDGKWWETVNRGMAIPTLKQLIDFLSSYSLGS